MKHAHFKQWKITIVYIKVFIILYTCAIQWSLWVRTVFHVLGIGSSSKWWLWTKTRGVRFSKLAPGPHRLQLCAHILMISVLILCDNSVQQTRWQKYKRYILGRGNSLWRQQGSLKFGQHYHKAHLCSSAACFTPQAAFSCFFFFFVANQPCGNVIFGRLLDVRHR